MQIKVIRKYFTPTCTIGEMSIDGVFHCYTLEDIYRGQLENPADKVQNETCIPYGTYKVIVDHSNHFNKDLPHILNVPCFEGIRIHGGNKSTDTEGCILVAANTNYVDQVSICAGVLQSLTDKICDAGECTIEIVSNATA